MHQYLEGLDILGDGLGIGDFVPYLNTIGKIASGLTGSSGGDKKPSPDEMKKAAQEAAKQALEQERQRAAAAKTQTLLYVVLGVFGVSLLGGVAYIATKKR